MRQRDRYDGIADAARLDEGTQPQAVLVMVFVPESLRGAPKSDVVRVLSQPHNLAATIDSIADTIVQYFNDPVSAARTLEDLQTAMQRAVKGEG